MVVSAKTLPAMFECLSRPSSSLRLAFSNTLLFCFLIISYAQHRYQLSAKGHAFAKKVNRKSAGQNLEKETNRMQNSCRVNEFKVF